MAKLVDLYLVYRILRRLTQPFKDWEAYDLGIIDDNGNILKKSSERKSQQEKDAFTKFDLMILKMKNLLGKVPGGKSTLASYAAALMLIKEGEELEEEDMEQLLEYYMSLDNLEEEIANVASSGSVAGFQGDGPISSSVLMKRFANNDVFVVDQARYLKCRMGKKKYCKYETYVGNDDVGNAIRSYGIKYPKKPIILQDEKTGAMLFLRYGKTGMFSENYQKLNEGVSKKDLDEVEKYADKLFAAVGIDVEFTRHFLDRVNDARNNKQITSAELIRLFRETYKKHGKKIPKLGPDAEAVLNDMKTDINMPFVLKWDNKSQEFDMVAKTVMRKKDFATSNQKLRV